MGRQRHAGDPAYRRGAEKVTMEKGSPTDMVRVEDNEDGKMVVVWSEGNARGVALLCLAGRGLCSGACAFFAAHTAHTRLFSGYLSGPRYCEMRRHMFFFQITHYANESRKGCV